MISNNRDADFYFEIDVTEVKYIICSDRLGILWMDDDFHQHQVHPPGTEFTLYVV